MPCALAAALALPHRAAAQQCTEQPCGPFDGTPPTVTVSPGNGANLGGGQTLVTVNWADNLGLDATSRSIIFDGVDVTSAFNWVNLGYSVIPVTARSEGYVDVGPGSHTFSATICDLSNEGPFCHTATATWNGPAASVRVTAASAPLTVPAGDSAVARYRVVNTGTALTQYTLSASCT
ncbi:MAG TPA: hypothetical protein VEQ60_30460, partial [Longimicrobium sp.]|nr:hypothetical protein [Longimicrobium sp.]